LHYTGTAALNATVQARDFFWFPPADPRFRRVGKKNFALFAGAADNNSKSDFVQIISKNGAENGENFSDAGPDSTVCFDHPSITVGGGLRCPRQNAVQRPGPGGINKPQELQHLP
jgi:hypothetical protein